MTPEDFNIELESAFLRSKKVLIRKEKEYSGTRDRLEQFHRAAYVQNTNPCRALIGMATKHFTSICDMSKDPTSYNLKIWREKITNLRNYTFLLDALLVDLEVE